MKLRDTFLFAESWNVAFRKKDSGSILQDTETTFTIIKNSYRYWAADPFVVEHEGHVYVFAELYDYVLCRGVLGYCEICKNKATKWKTIVVEPYHLSYPYIFLYKNNYIIMPESSEASNLTVYEAEQFPRVWKRSAVLCEGVKYADTTLLQNDKLEFALTHRVEDAYNPQLILVDLSRKTKEIMQIDAIPLQSRPAGKVFFYNSKWIRPAQMSEDCGDGYGKALIFYEIQSNENLSYAEKKIKVVYPEDLNYNQSVYLDGMHTYNTSEHYEVIDIKTRRFNVLNLVMRIISKFR